jgi:predicted transcriptional regulator
MASKRIKKLYIETNTEGEGVITKIFRRSDKEIHYNSEDIELLRKLLSNQKSRILYFLKKKKPNSIYSLSKLLKRDFKSVYQDLKVLERFGLVEFEAEKKGDRESLKPTLLADEIQLFIRI